MKILQVLSFKEIYKKLSNEKMSLKTAYKLNKIYNSFCSDISFYEENIKKIILEYGQIDEEGNLKQNADGTGFLIKEDCYNECNNKILELQNIEVKCPATLLEIEELASLEITPEELQCLMPFITE